MERSLDFLTLFSFVCVKMNNLYLLKSWSIEFSVVCNQMQSQLIKVLQ